MRINLRTDEAIFNSTLRSASYKKISKTTILTFVGGVQKAIKDKDRKHINAIDKAFMDDKTYMNITAAGTDLPDRLF